MRKYEFKKDIVNKKLSVKLRGQFNTEEGMSYIKDYLNQTNLISNKGEYILSVDCNEMGVTASDTTEALEHCFKLYKESNFKTVEFITSGNKSKLFLDMQFNRIGRKVGLNPILK